MPSQAGTDQDPDNWVDSSYSYAAARTQALTQWMDDYFGNPTYELESAQSLIRLDFRTEWDQDDGNNNRVRLRGKLQLPKVSKRLNLVFNDEQGDELDPVSDTRNNDNGVALVYEVAEDARARLDLTLGMRWNRVRPGVRFRFQDSFWDKNTYRFTQRLLYDSDDGAYAISQIEFNRALSKNSVVRWNNKAEYGEERDGVEWISGVSLFERRELRNSNKRLGISYFGSVKGVTDPKSYVKNYRVGVLFRRSIYRDYLFLELEPAYNYRKKNADDNRRFAWSIGLTFQIALESDYNETARRGDSDETEDKVSQAPPSSSYPEITGYYPRFTTVQ